LVLNKNKKLRENLSEGLKVRLASGLAQAVNFMLGIYAEPPSGLHGWTEIYWEEIIYVYIFIQLLYTYIYVYTQTHTSTTTTTPHMLVTGTRIKRDNKIHSQSSKP
jgi:hypothetical protein